MKLLLFIVALACGWFYLDRVAMAAPLESAGPLVRPIEPCDLPLPSDGAAMLFASYYEGAAVSPVRLGEGPQGDTTSVVDVKVRAGIGPLYVVIAGSRHSILAFSGWTSRIEKLVVATGAKYPVAVTGLPAERILFVDRDSCGGSLPLDNLHNLASTERDLSALAMVVKRPFPASMSDEERSTRKSAYRMPDAIGGAYEPATLFLSDFGVGVREYRSGSGRHGAVPDWFNNGSRAADFYPSGVAEVDMARLVTPVPAAPYRILPDRAGIAQLIRDGRIEDHGDGNYRVVAPIELPEGLCGAMSATFTVSPGVPAPSGDLCHSSIR